VILKKDATEELRKLGTIYPFFDLTQLNVYAMWPPPLFFWPMPRELIFDLIFGRTLVFAQLDYSKLFEMAQREGVAMRWAGDKELREGRKVSSIIPGSPQASAVAFRSLGQPEAKEQFLLIVSVRLPD